MRPMPWCQPPTGRICQSFAATEPRVCVRLGRPVRVRGRAVRDRGAVQGRQRAVVRALRQVVPQRAGPNRTMTCANVG